MGFRGFERVVEGSELWVKASGIQGLGRLRAGASFGLSGGALFIRVPYYIWDLRSTQEGTLIERTTQRGLEFEEGFPDRSQKNHA